MHASRSVVSGESGQVEALDDADHPGSAKWLFHTPLCGQLSCSPVDAGGVHSLGLNEREVQGDARIVHSSEAGDSEGVHSMVMKGCIHPGISWNLRRKKRKEIQYIFLK